MTERFNLCLLKVLMSESVQIVQLLWELVVRQSQRGPFRRNYADCKDFTDVQWCQRDALRLA